MLPYRDSRLTQIAIGIFFLLAVGYGYFELQGFLYGPRISVMSTTTEVHDPFVTVSGSVERIASLSMNGKEISVTENGSFSEPYLLSPGSNRIILDAKDKYGRSKQSVVTIVYTPLPSSPTSSAVASTTLTASSTESASTTPVAPTP